ncbi:MAG: prenyltransferase [Thermoleophilia bacterium]
MKPSPELLAGLGERFEHAVVVFVDDDGYPLSVATEFRADAERGVVTLHAVAGDEVQPPVDEQVNVVFSHIRPQPGVGYDERRYVSLWGKLQQADGELVLSPERAEGWDEQEMPFFELNERAVPQARRYFEALSAETGRDVRPKLSFGWLFLRATRLPFLSATFVPVLLGIAIAAYRHGFNWWVALLTVLGGAAIHLGINVFNDVFDTSSGADAANVNPTQFSGGSRVIHYGLVRMRSMVALGVGFYAVGIGIGVLLAAVRGWELLWIGVAGALIGVFYTAPPLRLVHRGLGEIAVAVGFGPIMALGAYFVQARHYALEPFLASLPVAILIALILYVNEVPDRPADEKAGKRTLPVRLSKEAVIRGYDVAVVLTFGLIAVFAVTGLTARPTLLALLAAPLAVPVRRALRESYDQPYALMPAMGKNIQLHLVTGLLLIVGYVIAIVADHALSNPPFFLS